MKYMKSINILFSIVMAAAAAVSCNVESQDNQEIGQKISFNVVLDNQPSFKSGDLPLRTENGEIPMVLERVVNTKTVQINNEGSFVTIYDGTFDVEGYEGNTQKFKDVAEYNQETGLWELESSQYRWKPGRVLEVAAAASASNFDNEVFFNGIVWNGTPSVSNFHYSIPEDKSSQKDLLVGYFKGQAPDGKVSLKFNHPLTSLQFVVGELPFGVTLTVNSITLEGIDESADCKATFDNSGTTYLWQNYSETKLDYEYEIDNPTPATTGDIIVGGDDTFIVIPRTFSSTSNAKIKLNVTEYNRTYDVEASLAGQEWKPGETNVYALSYYGLKQAILEDGYLLNDDFKAITNVNNIRHIVFETNSDRTSDIEVQAPTHYPIYLSLSSDYRTVYVSTKSSHMFTGTSCSNMFYGLTMLEDISGLEYLDTSRTVDMSFMFAGCANLKNGLDLSHFNTENVTDMSYMFAYLRTMTEIDLSSFDTRNVMGIGGLFSGDQTRNGPRNSIQSITFGNKFQLPKNRSLAFTFYKSNVRNLDLSFMTTNTLEDIEYAFTYCSSLQSVNLSGLGENPDLFFAPNVFDGCSSINTINFGYNITFQRVASGTASQTFFPRRNIDVICSDIAKRRLQSFGNGTYEGIHYITPTSN